ncbi:MAG: hypothetical protein QW460_01260 [Thermoplasmatales archaeon]
MRLSWKHSQKTPLIQICPGDMEYFPPNCQSGKSSSLSEKFPLPQQEEGMKEKRGLTISRG